MLISGGLAIGQYALLARAHHSERGLGTISYGGGLLAAGGIAFVLLLDTAFVTLAGLIWVCGLLILLAGTRRFFARPALLGWWASSLGVAAVLLLAQWTGLLTTQATLRLLCLLTVPLWLMIAFETRHADNDEQWAMPRGLLMAVLVVFSTLFFVIGLYLVPSENLHLTLLITLLVGQLALPYCYHNALSHRLHTRLIKLVRYDALTGLLNRRGIEESAIRELRRAQRYQQSFAMIAVNLRQFQEINQRYGFAAGDMALRKSARVLKDIAGDSGLSIGRFTGNDFILLCSNLPMQQIRNMMLEIELAINALQIEHSDSSFHLNCVVNMVKAGKNGDTVYELLHSVQTEIQKRKAASTPSKTAPSQQDVGALLNKIHSNKGIAMDGLPEAA